MSMMLRLYAAIGGLLFLGVICAACYALGRYDASAKCKLNATASKLEAVTSTLDANTAMQSAAASVDTASAVRHVQIETRYQPIDREVIRYVQTPAAAVACLDDDGMRLWRAANRGEFEPASAASTGHAALPGTTTTGEREGGRPAGEPRASGEDVPGMQSTPAGAGRTRPGSDAGIE